MRKFFCLLAAMILLIGAEFDEEVFFRQEKTVEVPIVMYHLVTTNKRYVGKHGITPEELAADLRWLKENDYNTVVMQDLINFVERGKRLPKKPIMLTFDDGNRSDYEYLFPLLEELDMRAVLAIIGSATDECSAGCAKNPTAKYPNMTWTQIKQMHDADAAEIISHSYDLHGRRGSGRKKGESDVAYRERLSKDLLQLQQKCEEHLGFVPVGFAYPLGVISNGSQEILQELGFKASLSCWEGVAVITRDEPETLFQLKRTNRPSGKPIETILAPFIEKQ